MTNQRKNEIIKALAYGETAEQIAAAEGVSMSDVQEISADCENEIRAETAMLRKAGYLNG